MSEFEQIFGVDSSKLKKTCVLMPFISSQMREFLKIDNLNKGRLYSSGSNDTFTVVLTRMGAGFVGDCICWLAEQGVKNIIFAGSCAGVNAELEIGEIVQVRECYAVDSFSSIISGNFEDNECEKLKVISENNIENVKNVVCLTTASIKNENIIVEKIQYGDIDVIDMESSAVIETSNKFGLNTEIFLFVQDIYPDKPFFRVYDDQDKKKIFDAQKRISEILWDTVKTHTQS